MRRTIVPAALVAVLAISTAACSGSEEQEEPDREFRIDGPAQVDDDVQVEPSGDDSGEG